MVRERGSGITPIRVVELLQKELKKKSKLSIAKNTGIGIAAISRYSSGIGEPTTATLQKLSNYFEVPVEWLRGEDYVDFWGEVYGDNLTEEKVEDLNYEFWRKRAFKSADSPIMVEIFRCLAKVHPEVRYAAFALFRNTCRVIETSSREELMRLALDLPMGGNMPTITIPDQAVDHERNNKP